MGLIPDSSIAEIRERTDIVAVIGEHVPLRRAGTNHLGLCPFHQEKSPSFNVSQSKQFFYCFGCQKSGDVFRFLMELEGRTFADVARDLARRAGVEIPEAAPPTPQQRAQRQQEETERARLLRLCELAARHFESELKKSPRALQYLDERGVNAEIRARFRIGYAPDSWDGLLRLIAGKGAPHELAERAGLVIRREGTQTLPEGALATGNTHYDRFRDRIIFPLIAPLGMGGAAGGGATGGDVIAFGGRVLPAEPGPEAAGAGAKKSEGAKYINSPETVLYKKGENLYGLHAARDAIRRRKQVILVEGNFDVLALHQAGFDNTVAPMGTALTETQARLLSRLIGSDGHVVLMLDGDRAGRSATLKDIFLFSQAGMSDVTVLSRSDIDVRVARLPDGEDPDTYAQRDPSGLERSIRAAKPAVDYVLDEAIGAAEHDSVAGKAKVLEKVAPLLRAQTNQTVREMYVDRLASELGIGAGLVWRHVTGGAGERAAGPAPAQVAAPPGDTRAEPSERWGGPPDAFGGGGRYAPGGPGRSQRPPYDRQGGGRDPSRYGYAPAGEPRPGYGQGGQRYGQGGQGFGQGGQRYGQGGQRYGQGGGGYQGRDRMPEGGYEQAGPPPGNAGAGGGAAAARSRAQLGSTATLNLLALCGDHPRLVGLLSEEVLDSVDSPVLSELLREARDLAQSGEALSVGKLIDLAPPELRPQVATAALSGNFLHTEHPERTLAQFSREIRTAAIEREVQDLTRLLGRLSREQNETQRHDTYRRIQELTLLKQQLTLTRDQGHTGQGHAGQAMASGSGETAPGATTSAAEGDTPR